jgi:GTP cyclohydrolase IA
MNNNNLEKLISQVLVELGEDPSREGLQQTPKRVAQMLTDLTSGNRLTREETINGAIFTERVHNMIVLKDIEVYSLCEHHLLPFFGKCHVGYVTKDKIIGISKIARIVDRFAKRLQVQERLTQDIATELLETLHPLGVGVVIEAKHLCMMMRGVQKQNSLMVTSSVLGNFRDDEKTRDEFMNIINSGK